MKELSEPLKLHKALSEAEVEYQKRFDALKDFEHLRFPPNITTIEQILKEWDKLREEEKAAYQKREVARTAYREYLKKQTGKSQE